MNASIGGEIVASIPVRKVAHVVRHLGVAHLWFEQAVHCPLLSLRVAFAPLMTLDEESLQCFEHPQETDDTALFPEVGSRAFQRFFLDFDPLGEHRSLTVDGTDWLVVQANRYRYWVSPSGQEVRIVLGEYLACRTWVED
jgi:hypothetical protein